GVRLDIGQGVTTFSPNGLVGNSAPLDLRSLRSQSGALVADTLRAGRCVQRVLDHLTERQEVDLAWRRPAPGQPYTAAGLRFLKTQQLHPVVTQLDIGRDFRNQRGAISTRHHLHDRCKARCTEARGHIPTPLGTIVERLISQTMAFFQQYKLTLLHLAWRHARGFRKRVVGGYSKEEAVWHKMEAFNRGRLERQRQQQYFESATLEISEQHLGLCFHQIKAQIGIPELQLWQQPRQDIRRQRGDDAKAQRSTQHLGSV